MYDFDRVYDRRPYNSIKWSYTQQLCPGEDRDILPLWVADMDFSAAPEVVAALEARVSHPIYGYGGKPEGFLEAFEEWLLRRHGLSIERDWTLFSPGIVPGLALAVRALTEPGDRVLIQPPVYHPFEQVISKNGRVVVESPLLYSEGRWSMDFKGLEAAFDEGVKMMILCSPHNPVGRVWNAEELEALAKLLESHKVILLSDEIHSDIVYAPRRHHPSLSFSEELAELCVAFYAPSKTFNIAGLQTSYVVIPNRKLRKGFEEEADRLELKNPNIFGAAAAEAAYRLGGPWLEELLMYLEGNARFLRNELSTRLPELEMANLEGTFLAWIDFRKTGLAKDLHEFLIKKAGLWLDGGSKFGTGGEGWARLNLGCPRSLLVEAIDRLEAALKGRR